MSQEHFIIELFCRVDEMLPKTPDHIQAKLSLRELVTLGLLMALKGSSQHAFYRWLKQNWKDLFPNLPERTRFFRRLKTHRRLTERFLAEPTIFGVIDSYGIELCHPIREVHQPGRNRIGNKGFASWKWIVGGQVTDSYGNPISRALISLTDNNGISRTVLSSSFGYYRFTAVPSGENYIISINSKRYQFSPNTQILFVVDNLDGVNFTADKQEN